MLKFPSRLSIPRPWFAAAVVLSAWLTSPLVAQAPDSDPSPHSDITLVSERPSVQPGTRTTIAIRMTMDDGWHTYWINPGDAGLRMEARWKLPEGVTISELHFPVPRVMPQPPLMSYGYEHELYVLADVDVAASVPAGKVFTISGTVDWLICAEVCLPATGDVSLDLPVVAAAGGSGTTSWASAIAATRDRLVRSGAAWQASAWPTDSGFALVAVIPSELRAAFRAPYFFVDSMRVLEHAAPQRVRVVGDTLVMQLQRSPFAGAVPGRLRGVVVADAGEAGAGWELDMALSAAPAPGDARMLLVADASDVMLTGGSTTNAIAGAMVGAVAGSGSSLGLWLAMAMALLGGLLLNLMPCVFPVLSVKILSFVEQRGDNPRSGRAHAMVFTLGVLVAFWVLAGTLLAIRAGGEQLGWGFQLQSPAVVAVLALGMFALALNMSGVFTLGASLTRLGGVGAGTRYADSFFTGLLAVVVATPCTAPFMGAALGFALTTSAVAGFAVFTALGVGLALPYMVLASSPQLLRRLPRPGPWLETFKQLLAFPLYATVVWLLWVLGRQTGNDAVTIVLLIAIVVAMAAWAAGRAQMSGRRTAGMVALVIGTVAIGAGAYGATAVPAVTVAAPAPAGWETWSPAAVAEARAAQRVVFVDFTAAWCLSCQVNERIALHTDGVERAFAEAGALLLQADWTSRDSVITKALAEFGRSGVPLYVVYPADPSAPPVVLPAVLTPGIVMSAIANARAAAVASTQATP